MYPSEVRQLAALVASKVYYHLGSYNDSLDFALGAEGLFDVTKTEDMYVETIIAKCIDKYTKQRQAEEANIDSKLEEIVNRMFERCFQHGQFRQAVGIAIETRRLDIFQRAISQTDVGDREKCDMLSYAFRVVMSLIQSRDYRCQLLTTLVNLYRSLATPDYVQMCQCHIFLDQPLAVANILEKLSTGSSSDALMAYQIAFDMYESATQQFLTRVLAAVRKTAPVTTEAPAAAAAETTEETMETDDKEEKAKTEPKPEPVALSKSDAELQSKIDKLVSILNGEKPIYLNLQFLIRNDHTDPLVLKQTKDAVRVSIW